MPTDWATSKAADHLFGDNFPKGAEVPPTVEEHIQRLAKLLDEVRDEFETSNTESAETFKLGMKANRDQIIAWLRGDFKFNKNAQEFADSIEEGDYEHPKGPPPVG
jgi:hypothetical protein